MLLYPTASSVFLKFPKMSAKTKTIAKKKPKTPPPKECTTKALTSFFCKTSELLSKSSKGMHKDYFFNVNSATYGRLHYKTDYHSHGRTPRGSLHCRTKKALSLSIPQTLPKAKHYEILQAIRACLSVKN
jgi:hypothetical protein